ncbi:MAG TPA: LytR C-terminal domain-containing protein [Candidatus Cloacimonas sp.]|nr:LytR C-terminal domain-containing protein [Candidatus Cloacimonas sp.]HOQ77444.1 LytR C-terminal domain-containing protein [Candidatus Cloacimonas sp.]HOU25574.1 LytR C-terminal domain-containing protein [Candidatus Cloacimonas sp.]HPH71018.1 LytR C-terminal domain-containing protein [Candidatus Cloacimonas sp.]HPZ01390.1 LytR C-terminal domain-containing protein [Candidatus Cloacimonas sp.]
MNLTNNPPENNLPPRRKIWFPIILILVATAAVVLFFGLRNKAIEPKTGYEEDQLPSIKIVVTNGCGYEHLAADFASALKDKNIEVVSLSQTPKPIYDKTIIVIRKGDMQDLERLKKMTGIQRWTSAYNEYYSADFEIIVGRDYEQFIPKKGRRD